MDKYIAIRGKSKSYSYRRRHSKEQATYYQQAFFNISLQTRELSVIDLNTINGQVNL